MRSAPEKGETIGAVTEQSAGRSPSDFGNNRPALGKRELQNAMAFNVEYAASGWNDERLHRFLCQLRQCAVELFGSADFGEARLDVEALDRSMRVFDVGGLLDHLVRSHKQLRRQLQSECFRGPDVQHKLNAVWLLYWQIAWFRAFQNLVDIVGCASKTFDATHTLTHERAGQREVLRSSNHWPAFFQGAVGDSLTFVPEKD